MFHADLKNFSRHKGDNSIKAAAYRAGLALHDTHADEVYDYSRRKGVASHCMLAPKGAPEWCLDPHAFWDINEAGEEIHRARVARELEVNLPYQLDPGQREQLAIALGQMLVDRYHCAVLVAVHLPSRDGDPRNHHCHLLMSARQITPTGLGERAGAALDARGGQGAIEVAAVRQAVADTVNAALAAAGLDHRVDPRSLVAQAKEAMKQGDVAKALTLSREPTKHRGKINTALDRKAAADAERRREMDAAIEQARAAGRLVETTPQHSEEAAQRERLGPAQATQHPPTPQHMLDRREFKAWFHWEMSPIAVHLGKAFARVRVEGNHDEVLRVEAELINAWLEAQRQAANEALAMVAFRVEPTMLNPDFRSAVAGVCVDRRELHAWKQDFFPKCEWLARKVADYARHARAEADLSDEKQAAWAKLIYIKRDHPHPRDPALAAACRAFERASDRMKPVAEQRRRNALEDALNEMIKAHDMIEEDFPIPRVSIFGAGPEVETEDAPRTEDKGSKEAKSGSNKQELKPQPVPPLRSRLSGSLGGRA